MQVRGNYSHHPDHPERYRVCLECELSVETKRMEEEARKLALDALKELYCMNCFQLHTECHCVQKINNENQNQNQNKKEDQTQVCCLGYSLDLGGYARGRRRGIKRRRSPGRRV